MTVIEAQLGPGPEAGTTGQPFRALIAMIGTATSDGRVFDSLTWREPPLTVYSQMRNDPGHEDAPIAGRVDRIAQDGNEVWAYGMLDTGSEDGRETIRLIREQYLRGVSVDAAVLDFREGDDGNLHFDAEVGAFTIVGFPAFRETQIELMDEATEPAEGLAATADVIDLGLGIGLTASGTPQDAPPRAWFDNPNLDKRYGLHIENDGRIWGHLYGWGECHVGSPRGQCVQLSPDALGYSYMVDVDGRGVVCDDGTFVRTGPLCVAADHADLSFGWMRAKDHYAHTGLAGADVVIGADAYGIWVAGAVRPGTSPEILHTIRASAPSVDCRPIGGRLEVVAVLSVNMPGFPALAARIENGRVMALVASGGQVTECSCGSHDALDAALVRLSAIEADLAPYRALRDAAVVSLEAELGLDPESLVSALESEVFAPTG